jgi:hypothetical protein
MAEKIITLQLGDTELPVTLMGGVIRREQLYGKQTKTVEKDGDVLQAVVLDPEGNVFLPSDIAHLPTDGQGSLTTAAEVQTEDGQRLPPLPSSFKEARPLRVDTIYAVACDLPPGLYQTEFAYRDAPVLKAAVLNVTPEGAFLLAGCLVETPLQAKGDVYSFFDEGDDPEDDAGDDDEISFEMF